MLAAFGLATLSKMGLLAFFAAWWTVLRFLVSSVNKQRIAIATIVIAVALLAQAPVRDALWSRVVAREARGGGEVAVNSSDIRLMILDLSLGAFAESPLTGIGFSRFMPYSAAAINIPLSSQFEAATHNTYLGVLVETGILGLIAFVLHFGQYIKRLPILLRRIIHDRDATVGAAVVGMPVVLVSAALNDLLLIYHFWAVCGLALACVNVLAAESSAVPGSRGTATVERPVASQT
jgi:O-antigen ligase